MSTGSECICTCQINIIADINENYKSKKFSSAYPIIVASMNVKTGIEGCKAAAYVGFVYPRPTRNKSWFPNILFKVKEEKKKK